MTGEPQLALSRLVIIMVMTLEPSPTDKFQPQWNSPYKIVEKVAEVTYHVVMPDHRKKEKLFHVLCTEFADVFDPPQTVWNIQSQRAMPNQSTTSHGEFHLHGLRKSVRRLTEC